MSKIVLWFTGLSGSGKTTIAKGLACELVKLKKKVKIIDGDNIRNSIHSKLGFTPADIELNNREIALLCKNFIKDFDIIISCGRKSVIPSICLKKNSKKKVYNIHIQDPKVSFNNFDFIIAPEHDDLSGENVILSKGSIHYLTNEEIVNNREYLIERLNKEKNYLTLILGGPNKYYNYNDQNLKKIFK